MQSQDELDAWCQKDALRQPMETKSDRPKQQSNSQDNEQDISTIGHEKSFRACYDRTLNSAVGTDICHHKEINSRKRLSLISLSPYMEWWSNMICLTSHLEAVFVQLKKGMKYMQMFKS